MGIIGVIFVFGLLLALTGGSILFVLSHRYELGSGELGVPPFRWVSKLASGVARVGRRLSLGLIPPSERLLNLSHGHLVSQYMMSIVRLGVADALEKEARSAAAVAEELGLHPASVAHMLRVLAAHGCFEIMSGTEHMVRHNATSLLLRSDHPQSLRPMILVLADAHTERAGTDMMAQQGGAAFVHTHKGRTFSESSFKLPGQPEGVVRSGEGMLRAAESSLFRLSQGGLLVDYEWQSHKRVIDISAQKGRFLSAILKAHRSLVGVVWDHPDAGRATKSWWRQFADVASARVTFLTGGDFEDLPQLRGGDALLLGFVLSIHEDKEAIALLKTLRRHVGASDVKLLIADLVVDTSLLAPTVSVLDAHLRSLGALRHRSESAWKALLLAGGFATEETTPCRGYGSIIQARPVEGVDLDEVGPPTSAGGGEKRDDEAPKPLLTPSAP